MSGVHGYSVTGVAWVQRQETRRQELGAREPGVVRPTCPPGRGHTSPPPSGHIPGWSLIEGLSELVNEAREVDEEGGG